MDARRPVPRLWIRSAEVRGERRKENGNTTTTIRTSDENSSIANSVDLDEVAHKSHLIQICTVCPLVFEFSV